MGTACCKADGNSLEPLCCRHRVEGYGIQALGNQVEEEPEPEGWDEEGEGGDMPPSPTRATAPTSQPLFTGPCSCVDRPSVTAETVEVAPPTQKVEPEYVGQWHNSDWNGQGRLVVPGLYQYEGSFRESQAHGHGIYMGEDGSTFEGQWFKDKKHGYGVFVHMDGTVYAGNWQDDVKSGSGVETWADGTRYKGEFFRGMRHGVGKYKSARGKYEGQFRNDKMEGQGRYEFSSGRLYLGQWQDGVMLGQGTMEFPDGSKYEGNYDMGMKSGNGTLTWPDGRRYQGQWNEGNQHGLGVMVNAAGVEVSGEWRNGNFTESADLRTAGLTPQETKGQRWTVQLPVHVRATPSTSADSIGIKERGMVVKGYSAGNWLSLADEPGFVAIESSNGEPLLQLKTSPR